MTHVGDCNLSVGRVVAPFGPRGEVKFLPHTDFPERFEKPEGVCAGKGEAAQAREIESAWVTRKRCSAGGPMTYMLRIVP